MKRRALQLIVVAGIAAVVVGLFASGVVDRQRAWAWCRNLFYRGKSAASRATQIRPPATRDPAAARQCRMNLRHIENAKRKVADARGMSTGRLTWSDIVKELPGGRLPKCPAGGEYQLMDLGVMPRCTIGGNGTPQNSDDHLLLNY